MAVRFLLIGACLLPMLAGCQGLALVNREPWAAAPVLRAQGIDEPLPEVGDVDDTPRMPLREFPALPSPSRPKTAERKLSLQEAVALALQDSNVVRTLSGGSVDAGGVTRFDPAVLEAQALAASAIFAPRLSYGYVGSRVNEPPSYYYGPGLPAQTRRDEGNFYASLSKPLPTGGTAGISYAPPLGYLFFPNGTSGLFNPAYNSALVFDLRQPLLRGAGYVVNTAPIRIAQLRTEQSTWRVKAALMSEVRSIEEAYWNLQAAYVGLQSIEVVLPLLEEVVRIEQLRFDYQQVIRADVARARVQLHQFRQQQIQARANVQDKEYQLRNLLNLPPRDGMNLIPLDPPYTAPPQVDLDRASIIAQENQPDLVRQRVQLRIREAELDVAANGVKPQVDITALYRASGLGQGLDDALDQMSTFNYTDWTLGASYSIPLGNVAARANLLSAELTLARERAVLRQNVQSTMFAIADVIRDIYSVWAQYELTQLRVSDSRVWMETARIRFSTPPPGGDPDSLLLGLNDYQLALRSHVDALTDASLLLARYNTLLARLEETQGTLLESRQIALENDPILAVQQHPLPLPLALEPAAVAEPPPSPPLAAQPSGPPATQQGFDGTMPELPPPVQPTALRVGWSPPATSSRYGN